MKTHKTLVLVIIQQVKYIFILISLVGLLYNCASIENYTDYLLEKEKQNMIFTEGIPGCSQWIILPFRTNHMVNINENMLIQFERILKVQLPSYGVANSKLTEIKNRKLLQKYNKKQTYITSALDFASAKKADFAIDPQINKLKTNKNSTYLEISLTIYDRKNRTPVWHVNGKRTGKNHESLLSVYRKLIADLLKLAPIGDYDL